MSSAGQAFLGPLVAEHAEAHAAVAQPPVSS